MAKKPIKVYHVQIGVQNFYFGSKKAIFDHFTKEEIGIKYNSFRNVTQFPFDNGKCIIREGILVQTTTNRGNKKTKEEPMS